MKFPGSKLLHHWDLPAPSLSVDDLLRSCQQVGLTGFVEAKTPVAVAMIFYYLGGEVNALYREGPVAFNGAEALDRLRGTPLGEEGAVSVYELPLDVAHLLRGITKRQKLRETLKSRAELVEFLLRMEKAEHTGTLEIQSSRGSAMLLLVRGRLSNVYWETAGGLTFEKGEARQKLDESIDREESMLFLAEFSRDVWKGRHEVQTAIRSRLEKRDEDLRLPAEQLVAEEVHLRRQVLDELTTQVPALIQAFMFDMLTGTVYVRKGKGISALKVGLLAERVPALTMYVKDLVALEDQDQIEVFNLSTERVAVFVAAVPEAQEAIAVIAEKSQPTLLIESSLRRLARSYASRLSPARGAIVD